MNYTVCTGLYNHAEEMLGTTKQERFEEENFKKEKKKRYLINNDIFKALKRLGVLSGGTDVMTSITLDSSDIKKTFHVKYTGSKNDRVNKYFLFFDKINPDINFMKNNDILPFFIKKIKEYNSIYNEGISFSAYYEPCGTGDVNITFYYRSLRTKFVVVENISDKIIKNIVFHVDAYVPSDVLKLHTEDAYKNNKDMVSKEIPFPLDILKKDESIVFPLDMKIVTPEYASGHIYEPDNDDTIKLLKQGNVKYFEYEHMYKAKFNDKKKIIEPVKDKNKLFGDSEKYFYGKTPYKQSIPIGSIYKIKYITFKVDGDREKKIYRRDFSPENLIYVNNSCECGSCPLLFAKNKNNQWTRLREIITDYKDRENEGGFEYSLPLSAEFISIKENKSETSYFRNMAILIKTRDDKEIAHYIDNYLTVSYDKSLLIDLSDIKNQYSDDDIISLRLTGYGYYQSDSKTTCTRVLNLDDKYFRE